MGAWPRVDGSVWLYSYRSLNRGHRTLSFQSGIMEGSQPPERFYAAIEPPQRNIGAIPARCRRRMNAMLRRQLRYRHWILKHGNSSLASSYLQRAKTPGSTKVLVRAEVVNLPDGVSGGRLISWPVVVALVAAPRLGGCSRHRCYYWPPLLHYCQVWQELLANAGNVIESVWARPVVRCSLDARWGWREGEGGTV